MEKRSLFQIGIFHNVKYNSVNYKFWVSATCSILVISLTSSLAHAQAFTGNQTTSGPFTSGTQTFSGNSKLNASSANAVSGTSVQTFGNNSMLNALASQAVNGGTQTFNNNSTLNVSAFQAVSGGSQTFNNNSTLNASA